MSPAQEVLYCMYQGCSAAFYAAQKGLDDILEVLVENGADLELSLIHI